MEIAVILLLSCMLRLLFVPTPSSDNWVHLWMTLKCRRGGLGSHGAFNSLIPGTVGYPSLSHCIVGCFPERLRIAAGYALNILYDCLSISLVYVVARYLFLHVWPDGRSNGVFAPHVAATLIFGTMPVLLPIAGRVKNFGGRTSGGLLVLIYFILFGWAFLWRMPLLFVACIPVGVAAVMASQFATQTLVFFSVGLSICYLSLIPLAVLMGVFACGCAIGPLGVRRILDFMLNHYIWYVRVARKTVFMSQRNVLYDILRLPIYLFRRPARFLQLCFTGITPIIILYMVPVLWWFAYWAIVDVNSLAFVLKGKVTYYLFSLVATSAVVAVLTSLRPLLFLGESERYFEYSAPALALLFVLHLGETGTPLSAAFWLVLVHIILILGTWSMLMRGETARHLKAVGATGLDEVAEFLVARGAARVVTIPTKLAFALACRVPADEVLFYYDWVCTGRLDGFGYMLEDEILYSHIRPDFRHFRDKYDVTTVAARKSAVASIKKEGVDYSLEGVAPVFQNAEYAVYDIGDLIR